MDIYQRAIIVAAVIAIGLVVLDVFRNSGKIRQAVAGSYFRSTCCGATSTPMGWTQDGWVSTCDSCGAWQYLGDDHDNPPTGFEIDAFMTPFLRHSRFASGGVFTGSPLKPGEVPAVLLPGEVELWPDTDLNLIGQPPSLRRHPIHDHIVSSRRPAPRSAANGPESIAPDSGPTPICGDPGCPLEEHRSTLYWNERGELRSRNPDGSDTPGGFIITRRVEDQSPCTCPADERPPVCQRRYALSACVQSYETEVDRLVAGFRERHPEIAAMWDSGCGLCGGVLEHLPDCPKAALIDMTPDFYEGQDAEIVMPPPPNIGGEGHPDYQGPHYDVEHDRFVPYDVLRDPEPDAAVRFVGDAGPAFEDKNDD